MTFPATSRSLSSTWQDMQTLAGRVKAICSTTIQDIDTGQPMSARSIINLYVQLKQAQVDFADMAAVEGLQTYVQSQLSNQTIDIVAEYQGMQSAIQAVADEITATFPQDAEGYLLAAQWSSIGISYRTFPASTLSALRTKLSSVVGTIS